MKKLNIILSGIILLTFSIHLNAQIRTFGSFLATGTEDAEKLLEAYLSPYLNGLGAGMTGGWYNTAKPHQLGGFDITFTGNVAITPPDASSFDLSTLGLVNLAPADANDIIAPTISGENADGPMLSYNYQIDTFSFNQNAFRMPPGTGNRYVPAPMISVGIGLVKGTEIMGRYLPNIGNDKGKIGFWGVGLKHDVKQWIPGLEKVPVLNISVMGGYTRMKAHVALEIDPDAVGLGAYYTGENVWNDQQMQLLTSGFTGNLLISADLPVVCFYGGVGFATTKTNLKMAGNYPTISGFDTDYNPVVVAEKDPIDFEVKNQDGGVTKPRLNIGMRLKLGVFTMHFDYTRANYNVLTGGIGFSFR